MARYCMFGCVSMAIAVPCASATATTPWYSILLDRWLVMLPFTGVSLITDGKNCTTSAIDAGTDSGYHLLVVKGYSRTVQESPNGKHISSGPFIVGGHQWCINYYPKGCFPSSVDFITLDLHLVSDIVEMEEGVKVNLEFSFIDQIEYQKPMHIRSTEARCFTNKVTNWGYEEFMKRDVLERSDHLKDDCFTIRCDIMLCNDLHPLADIGQHFKILLEDKLGSDVTFEVSNETFVAHRCVLAARSKVFKSQLFGPMTEGITSGVIKIKDMEPKVFAALLSFIYTDAFPSMDEEQGEDEDEEGQDGEDQGQEEEEEGQEDEAAETVTWLQDLFVAADRYDIQQLMFLCENELSKHIGVSSVASTLALAEQHQCHGLKEACLKFIQAQSLPCLKKVMETDDWKKITGTYGSVLNKLIVNLVSNQKTDKKRKR